MPGFKAPSPCDGSKRAPDFERAISKIKKASRCPIQCGMAPRTRVSARAAAFQEAAQAIARLHVGAQARDVLITRTGGGSSHGAHKWPGRGEAGVWKWLLELFAGSYAQSFASRRSLWRTFKHSGKLELEEAAPAINWLVSRGYVRNRTEALRRVHAATLAFLLLRWDSIERVAARLLEDGQLSARQVKQLARV